MADILLVEDVPEISRLIVRALAITGHEVTSFPNGARGLDHFAAETPDLVVLDVVLPDIDGIEVCRLMRQLEAAERRARTPILLVTALSLRHVVDDGLAAGADGSIAKPFTVPELQRRVAALLFAGAAA